MGKIKTQTRVCAAAIEIGNARCPLGNRKRIRLVPNRAILVGGPAQKGKLIPITLHKLKSRKSIGY